jgi:hypothetical protein
MTGYLETIALPWTLQHIQTAMMSDFSAVQKSIDRTDGGQLWNGINELDDAVWVFSRSTTELLDEITIFGEGSKDVYFWSKIYEKNERDFVREVKRKLYYSTSSLMTVVDIARLFNKRWPLEDIFEQRNKFFSTPGLHDFLQNLRNFSSHWRIAQANWRISHDSITGKRTASFIITKDELLEWKGWGSKAKEYIESAGNSIDIYDVFTQYKKHVQQYYEWHKGAILVKYAPTLRPFFEYKKIHEGLQQKFKWNMIISFFKPGMNAYEHLIRHLTNKQIEMVFSYEHRSEQQIDALIKILDVDGICDVELRNKLMRIFGVSI